MNEPPSHRARIVVTLGPATDPLGMLEALIQTGVDVVRVNFSHGAAADHVGRIARARAAAHRLGRRLAILGDLPGPKLRALLSSPLQLRASQEISFAIENSADADVHVTMPEALRDVRPGQRILLDDGRLLLRAVAASGPRMVVRVEAGGTLLPNKGINLPDTPLSLPPLTARDHEALATAAEAGVDWLALSFVRSASAAAELRSAAQAQGLNVPILAKIERPEAVEHSEEILSEFDGVMVARGDLGVEIGLEHVPRVQKRLITLARSVGKPVVTATDMLDSMRTNLRPTRAEVSDVANAVYDGTGAVMLSGETAVGAHPLETVVAMLAIVRAAEADLSTGAAWDVVVPRGDVDDHVTHATCTLAREVGANAIVTPTNSGRTARLIARHRPRALVIAAAHDETVLRQLKLVWGLGLVKLPDGLRPGHDRLEEAVRSAFSQGALTAGQLVVALAGHPLADGDRSPTIRLLRVGTAGQSHAP